MSWTAASPKRQAVEEVKRSHGRVITTDLKAADNQTMNTLGRELLAAVLCDGEMTFIGNYKARRR